MDDEITYEHDIFAELAKAKASPMTLQIDTDEPSEKKSIRSDFDDEAEGQLTIDVFQDEDNVYVQSAVAGVSPDDLEINITKEAVTVRGKRERTHKVSSQDFFYQECFWGGFSRSVVLPQEVDPDRAVASLKNGVLTIKMPKFDRRRSKNIKVKSD
ncbi:hypothetical protein A3A21_03930 [Candidatus Jorgensenbacteria bacterium RIFCSPLOWO2_01_FULL_45_25b]|uniref:SHSP domain-containing protein n=1 Tax=Candidatus Jorgensenbacteria bacterium RIFCSPLOWO2_01_FULL_45_25b TaxID=1798471 RepID=A0A1F6BWF0_9BACT|nr:MAG: hypothetical protein A3A21_03930 [Candidatus Jorgensenbacteria bacterium RIFCSPLOWO2_01_FULL_45_25b]